MTKSFCSLSYTCFYICLTEWQNSITIPAISYFWDFFQKVVKMAGMQEVARQRTPGMDWVKKRRKRLIQPDFVNLFHEYSMSTQNFLFQQTLSHLKKLRNFSYIIFTREVPKSKVFNKKYKNWPSLLAVFSLLIIIYKQNYPFL